MTFMDHVRTHRGRLTGILLVAVAAAGLSACSDDSPQQVRSAAQRIAAGWSASAVPGTGWDAASSTVAEGYRTLTAGLGQGAGQGVTASATVTRVALDQKDHDRATSTLHVTWTWSKTTSWSYDTTLRWQRSDRDKTAWIAHWSAAAVHPGLEAGDRLALTAPSGQRAPILAADGTPLTEGPGAGLAAAFVGTTADQAGVTIGQNGLEKLYDAQLRGTAGMSVTADGSGQGARTLFTAAPTAGQPVRTTLDTTVQRAAEAALQGATKPTALVAVRIGTGEVVAVANGGSATPYNRAMLGHYPPGSVFKIVSSYALLTHGGITPTTTVPCPQTTTIGGRTFKNAEQEQLGPVDFATDFAESCNTAFLDSSTKVTGQQITDAAHTLGLTDELATGGFGGSVPVATDPVEHAASMIGQGKVEVSPLAVAGVVANVAAGSAHPLRFVAGSDSGTATPLDAGAVATLQQMMRGVVTSGTASALAHAPGAPVAGKTGTAEYGTDDPPRTHAWFAGYQGQIAFAVLVEDGGFGAAAAVPVAGAFLRGLS